MHSLLMLLMLSSTPVPPGGEHPPSPMPTPKISISRQTPASKLRSVSSEEVKAALERIQNRQAGTQPTTPTPAADPGRHPVEVYHLDLKPKSELPIQRLERVGPPKKSGVPAWTPLWEAKKQFASSPAIELKLDYQWTGVVAAIEMRPENPEARPNRVLLNKAGIEILNLLPDTNYKITVMGRLPANTVWIPLYTFDKMIFKRGQGYQVAFPASIVKDLKEYLVMADKERIAPVSTPKPVELNATPVAGMR